MENTNTVVANTTASNLLYDGDLLTKAEKRLIVEGWDGEAIISDSLPERIVIGVHDGFHHADEALCVAMLRFFLGGECKVSIVETRDQEVLASCDVRCDVGEGLLDHHGKRADKEHSIAACSRVYTLLRNSFYDGKQKAAWSNLLIIVEKVAAIDCGNKDPEETPFPWFWKLESCNQLYKRHGKNPVVSFENLVERIQDEIGAQWALDCAEEEATEKAIDEISKQKEKSVVSFSKDTRDADVKRLLWEETGTEHILYYVSPESEEDWRVLCCASKEIPYSPFSSKKLIPEKYRGLRGDSLSEVSGVSDATFCHIAGFIAGFKSKEAAEEFALLCAKED